MSYCANKQESANKAQRNRTPPSSDECQLTKWATKMKISGNTSEFSD